MRSPQVDEQPERGIGDRLWYLSDRDHVRPTWRVVIPLVVGVLVYTVISIAPEWLFGPFGYPMDTATSALLLASSIIAPTGAAVAVFLVASRLESQPLTVGARSVSKPWLRDFGGGIVIGLLSVVAMFAVWVTDGEATMRLEPVGVGTDSVILGVVGLVGIVASLLAMAVFLEFLFRRIIITNVVDAYHTRVSEPSKAVVIAVAVSVVCYGGFELLAGGFVDGWWAAIPAALLGLYHAAGYLFTGRLAVPIGLNFGGLIALSSLHQITYGTVQLPSIVAVDTGVQQSMASSVRLQFLRVLAGGVLLGVWIAVFYDDFSVDDRLFQERDE